MFRRRQTGVAAQDEPNGEVCGYEGLVERYSLKPQRRATQQNRKIR